MRGAEPVENARIKRIYDLFDQSLVEAGKAIAEIGRSAGQKNAPSDLVVDYYLLKARFLHSSFGLDSASYFYQQALKKAEKASMPRRAGEAALGMGMVLLDNSDEKGSWQNLQQALAYANKLGNTDLKSRTMLAVSGFYFDKDSVQMAEDVLQEVIALAQKDRNLALQGNALHQLSNILLDRFKLGEAKQSLNLSLGIFQKLKRKRSLVPVFISLSLVYWNLNQLDSALYFQNRAKITAIETGDRHKLQFIYQNLSGLFEQQKRYADALYYLRTYHRGEDSIFNIQKGLEISKLNQIYQSEKKQAAINLLEAKAQRSKLLITFFLVVILLALALLIFIARASRQRKIANLLLTEKNEAIALQNKLLDASQKALSEKNSEVTKSIEYAWGLQHTILPEEEDLKRTLGNHALLYLPKDIVAGDFYWLQPMADGFLLAACDCTGHGVPGAMVSLVCHQALSRAYQELSSGESSVEPSAMLNRASELVEEAFSAKKRDDGMDVSLLRWNRSQNEITWSGANLPLWVLSQEGKFSEWKGDKQPVGRFAHRTGFTDHRIALEPGDRCYLFTDGFADQFGGPKGKKIKRRAMQTMVQKMRKAPLEEQTLLLHTQFLSWKGDLDQVDDVLVMGICPLPHSTS